jgi:predicted transcriptional regulator of viral defense system
MSIYEKLKSLVGSNRPFSAAETTAMGIPTQALVEFCRRGEIERLCRGIYISSRAEFTENTSFQIVAERVPSGVICLLSALQFHGITTQLPNRVWVATKRGTWQPEIDYPPVQYVTLSEGMYSSGIEEHNLGGVNIKIYSLVKTVVDCFKFRNKIGLDVAIEALKEGRNKKMFTADQLWQVAKSCRMDKIMQPYQETLSS